MSRLKRVLGLGRREWAAFWEAWLVLLGAELALRLLPFRRARRLLEPREPSVATTPPDPALVARLAWAVQAASRHHVYPMRCLARSLALRQLLGRRGIGSELRIGVARDGGVLRAHAWVERAGRPVGEPENVVERYAPLLSGGSRAASAGS